LKKTYSPPENLNPPAFASNENWMAVPEVSGWSEGKPFLSWGLKDDRVCLIMYRHPENQRVAARVWFGPGSRGGPGQVHGGAISAVLDQLLGFSAWNTGMPCVTARLAVDFRGRIELGVAAWVEAWVERTEERKVITRGSLINDEGKLLAEAEGLFILVKKEYFQGAAEGFPMP